LDKDRIILSSATIDDDAKARLLKSLGCGWEFITFETTKIREEELNRVEILLVEGGRKSWLTKERLQLMPALRMIQTFSAGVDHLDFRIIPPQVLICSNAGAYGGPISEFVLGAIITLGRNFSAHDRDLREGKFVQSPPGLYLKGKTIGILGTGGIGQAVAHLSKSFGMRVLGVNTTGRSIPDFDEVDSPENGLDSLLQRSDVIVVALPLTVKTRNLLGRDQFRILKPASILVNVARGAIINQEALYEFLRDHPDARAAIDVWWRYPDSGENFAQDYPISSLPNVLSSPHFSDGVDGQLKAGSVSAVDNIIRYIKKEEPLRGVVQREDYIGLR
jgi:phosphoglycerate dehydrogenase-like enzyme